ncbi:alternative ribosome rescue aminoacyl-tRNA hydrolase ArfB [Glycomyces salinus]|uniref:alternative ribosome rescue aminoacyl-tRNA hydrolase ArfB n=1 Tax=Glycomyces salinus TaxID=980294 RepID=UPI0035566647
MPLKVTDDITIPDTELRWRFSRSSGPGGQSVNTTDSRVELVFDLRATNALPQPLRDRALERLTTRLTDGALIVTASQYRSQLRNRQAALERMGQTLRKAIAAPPPKRKPTKPTRGSQRRRLEGKRRRSEVKRLRRDTSD